MVGSLYIHIPFCQSKCLYCSFSSFAGLEAHHDRYVQALITDIETRSAADEAAPLETIFIGGGTPTILQPESLTKVLECIYRVYDVASSAEISIEANPGTTDLMSLRTLRSAGFNRLSIGMQSLDDSDLDVLGRRHRSHDCLQALEDAREAGFENISLDLMYGLPGQTVGSWEAILERALSLSPDHLSLYQLTIEENTPFYRRYKNGLLVLPEDVVTLEMEALTAKRCHDAGYIHYEISNYAQPGSECRHNLVYWHNEEYLAAGAGAVAFVNGVRAKTISDPLKYCEAIEQGRPVVEEQEKLGREASFRESVVMGLRLINGIKKTDISARYGLTFTDVYGSLLSELEKKGLLEQDGGAIRLTGLGRRLANQVMAELV